MHNVFVDITSDFSKVPNLPELMEQEHATAAKWRTDGILIHLFVKEKKDGAILVFQNADKETVKKMVETLPLFPWFDEINYLLFDKSF